MPPKRGPKKGGADLDAAMKKMVEEAIKTTEVKESINPIPQKEILLNSLITHTEELQAEDAYRRKKLIIFMICLLSNIIGIIISLYSMHQTVLFQELPQNWTYFGVSCIFYIPCWAWFFWTICPRYKDCHFCPNYLFLKEHALRVELKSKRDERNHIKRMQKLYLEGDIDPPEEALDPPDVPYEYDPTQPWAYIRWKPKPPIKVRYDEEGVAWIVTPEEQAKEEADRIKAAAESKGGDTEDYEGMEEGVPRRSSVMDRKKSTNK